MRKFLCYPTVMAAAAALFLGAGTVKAADDLVPVGEKAFKKYCMACHSLDAGKNGVGPSLFGVVGRQAGSVAGYNYSSATKSSGITWNDQTLDPYLTNPKAVVPGTKMTFAGVKDATERAGLIAYLGTKK